MKKMHAKPSKYKAIRTEVDGVMFASKREAKRYGELKLLERAGAIYGLELQPAFDLTVKGVKIGRYVGDFRYVERKDLTRKGDQRALLEVIEDVKSKPTKTPIYRWKVKHLLAEHGIQVREVN